jgi:hypothetical protein
MPIAPLLDGYGFDRETKRVISVAFEMVRIALGLSHSGALANEIIAKIIEFARERERNPDLLCERTLNHFREQH